MSETEQNFRDVSQRSSLSESVSENTIRSLENSQEISVKNSQEYLQPFDSACAVSRPSSWPPESSAIRNLNSQFQNLCVSRGVHNLNEKGIGPQSEIQVQNSDDWDGPVEDTENTGVISQNYRTNLQNPQQNCPNDKFESKRLLEHKCIKINKMGFENLKIKLPHFTGGKSE